MGYYKNELLMKEFVENLGNCNDENCDCPENCECKGGYWKCHNHD